MPRGLAFALAGVVFQALGNGVAGLSVLMVINDRLDHGQEVENLGLARTYAYVSIAAAIVLVLCFALTWARLAAVWVMLVVCQVLQLVGGLVGLVTGAEPTVIIGMAISVAVVWVLNSEAGREWFNVRSAPAQEGGSSHW